MEKTSLTKEIKGTHYQQYKVQPIELIMDMGWNFIQGNIAKYVLRAKYKNGQEDIDKAIHYCELGMDLDDRESYADNIAFQRITNFIQNNELNPFITSILLHIEAKSYKKARELLLEKDIVRDYFLKIDEKILSVQN